MAEFINSALQVVEAGQNVVFTNEPVHGGNGIVHRAGSGIVTLRGLTNQCKARYKVSFGGNLGVPGGGTISALSIAISLDGETLESATAVVTPVAVGDLANVFTAVYIEVPRGCCATVSVKNTTAQAINVANANMIVERVA